MVEEEKETYVVTISIKVEILCDGYEHAIGRGQGVAAVLEKVVKDIWRKTAPESSVAVELKDERG